MAPTICLVEFPMVGTTVNPYVHRRRKSRSRIKLAKRQRLVLEQMILHIGTIIETSLTSRENCLRKLEYINLISDCSIPDKDTKHPTKTNECYKKLVTPRRDLLSIITRTIILVQRNYILQRRLNALRAEIRRFLRSVLINNPQSQCQELRLQTPLTHSEDEMASSMEKLVPTLSPLLGSDSRSRNLCHGANTFICNNHDHTNDESKKWINLRRIQAEANNVKFLESETNDFSDDT